METMPCVGDNVVWNLITYRTGGWESKNVCLKICVFMYACVCLRKKKKTEGDTNQRPRHFDTLCFILLLHYYQNNVALK